MNQTWTRAMLKENAKQLFKKNYWVCVGITFILTVLGSSMGFGNGGVTYSYEWRTINNNRENNYYDQYYDDYYDFNEADGDNFVSSAIFASIFIIVMVIIFAVVLALDIFVCNIIEVGGKMFFVQNRNCNPPAGCIFDGFKKGRYGNIMKTMFFRDLYVFLWSLLLIVPGIIKAYEYLMVPYILAENPAMDRRDVFALSKRMMDGQKWNAMVLDLSFYGWFILSAVTCGLVGIFYVMPYYMATITELYAFNKIKAYNEGYIR